MSQLSMRIPEEIKREIKVEAAKKDKSMTGYIVDLHKANKEHEEFQEILNREKMKYMELNNGSKI